jgi:cytochrome P450
MSDELLTTYTATITFDRYEAIRQALFDANLSRSFDKRSYHDGNIRDGVVSISHGPMQRARRRVENSQFRADQLKLYERELFPTVMSNLLDLLIDDEQVDVFMVAEMLSVVLAARRAGIDHDPGSLEQLRQLVQHVDAFSQGAAILDARDPEAIRALVYASYEAFERAFVRPSWERRAGLIEAHRRGELTADELPHDILTVLLLHREDDALELSDDGRVVREVATYLQGGTHTTAQTLTNALDLMFEVEPRMPGVVERVAADVGFAQRVVHETLRLRPTTPKLKRRAEADTIVAGVAIPKDALVVLDAATAHRDASVFGPDADEFNPDRQLDPSIPRWGLAFGAGSHQCPGRTVAGGFPAHGDVDADEEHLFGLVALEIQAVCARGVQPDPSQEPERDLRTERHTRWRRYPVRFAVARAAEGVVAG